MPFRGGFPQRGTGGGEVHHSTVAVDPAGTFAWVTNSGDNSLSAVDLADRSVSATVPVGERPSGVSYSPRPPAPGASTVELDLPAAGAGDGHPGHS